MVFERLAVLGPRGAPIDSAAYRPGLAERWERVDSLNWRFHLRPGRAGTTAGRSSADDVVFSFEAFADSSVNAVARSQLAGRISASVEDSSTVLGALPGHGRSSFTTPPFTSASSPSTSGHPFPGPEWEADTALARLVGSGPTGRSPGPGAST